MPADPHACKISMLWNWYTVDACFISETWHITSKGMFGGSCVGVFFFVFAYQWISRVSKEFDALVKLPPPETSVGGVLLHRWLLRRGNGTLIHHLVRCILYTIQWGASYLIMLLFMYYNGYIIISCILGAFFGKLVFGYNEPGEEVGCCKV